MTSMRLLFSLIIFSLSVPVTMAAETAKKQSYTEVHRPLPVTGDKIKVVEYFWYGCPHCYNLEPKLRQWLKNKPDDVVFHRIPAVLTDAWLPQAKAFYIAEKLGITEEIHPALFDHIHRKKRRLKTQKTLREFFSEYDVDPKAFNELYTSKEIVNKIKAGLLETQRLKITGVPTVSVQGKYVTSGRQAGGNEQMLAVIDELIARERRLLARNSGAP